MKFPPKILDSLPYVFLPILCVFFDEALKVPWINSSDILRALFDNCGHGTIAFVSWLAVAEKNNRAFTESLLCSVIASAIDLDHFVMAKSYTLKDALSLPKRPPLHSTSILIPVLVIMFIIALYYPLLSMLPFITTVSVVSHHVRDGHRRGIWFWPVGNTPPIPYWLYLLIIVLLPLNISLIVQKVSSEESVTSAV